MQKKIILIPLDERPVNLHFPEQLLNGTEYNIVTVPREYLGLIKIPGNVEKISSFLLEQAKDCVGVIVSLNTLLYGGLVASRIHNEKEEDIRTRLSILKIIKKQNPKITIYAFNTIMRCPAYSSDEEEPDYYEVYGRRIFLSGFLNDKINQNIATQSEKLRYENIIKEIPCEVLQDYTARRKQNLDILKVALDYVEKGIIDFFVVSQDDCSPYGYTAIDRKEITKCIQHLCISTKCYMYPGADEVGNTLITRLINKDKNIIPKVYIRYASCDAYKVIPLYEDRFVGETIKYQIIAAGGIPVYSLSDCDLILMVNCPAQYVIESADFDKKGENYSISRNLNEFVEFIQYCINKKIPVTIADIAYANGGDIELIDMLKQSGILYKISGYAGWNSSSNTLGTAIPMGMFSFVFGNKYKGLDFLIHRYIEDVGYMSCIRWNIVNNLNESSLMFTRTDTDKNDNNTIVKWPSTIGREKEIGDYIKYKLQEYINNKLCDDTINKIIISDISFPWNRIAEIELKIER